MKKLIFLIVIIFGIGVQAQFKEPAFTGESPSNGILNNSSSPSNDLLGFINLNNFSMHHSIGLSYLSFGGQGLSLATYTNSMMYKFSDNMNVQLDASFVTSPYSSLGKNFQNSLQGIYISKAAINYKPWNDVYISIQYRNIPNAYYNPYSRFGYYNNLFYGGFSDYDNDPFRF
jgi:hypothetical protein